mgnify:CR=1 FL=1
MEADSERTYLAGSVCCEFVLASGFIPRNVTPDRLVVDLDRVAVAEHGGKGRRDHDSLHCWGERFDRLEDSCCSLDGWI